MTRRTPRALAAVTALGAALALAGCSGDTDPDAEARDTTGAEGQSTPSGPFEYEDGRGRTVHLEQTPGTVVAQSSVAAALWDAGYQVDGVYGELAKVDGELSYQAGDIDLSQVEVIGETYGEFDVEKYAVMNPDLLIDYTFDEKTLWYVPAEQSKQILDLAPSVGVNGVYTDTDEAIEEFMTLAAELGADTESEELQEAEAAYDQALEEVAATAEEKQDLQVLFVSADVDGGNFYVANPDFFPETGSLVDAGVDVIEPKSGKPMHFHQLSWEKVGDYAEADLILFDARTYDLLGDKLQDIDTWANLLAVKAGQVHEWYAAAPYSYEAYAEVYGEIAGWLAEAEPVG